MQHSDSSHLARDEASAPAAGTKAGVVSGNEAPLKLEAGASYRRRDGSVVTLQPDKNERRLLEADGWWYDPAHEFGWRVFEYRDDHPHDLIARVEPT